jgi:hypothetical protein
MDLEQRVREHRDDLQRLTGEIRLQVHLAGAQARAHFDRLEPKVREFSRQVDHSAKHATNTLWTYGNSLMTEARELWQEVKKTTHP